METESKVTASVPDIDHVFAAAIAKGAGSPVKCYFIMAVALNAARKLLFQQQAKAVMDELEPFIQSMTETVITEYRQRMQLRVAMMGASDPEPEVVEAPAKATRKKRSKKTAAAQDAEIAE